MKKMFLSLLLISVFLGCFAQTDSVLSNQDSSSVYQMQTGSSFAGKSSGDQVFRLKPKVDIPVTAVGVGWSLYAFTKIYSKPHSTEEEILALNKNDLSGINRFGVELYSPKAYDMGNVFFYSCMPYPLVLMLDKDIRKDAGKVAFLWAESMAVTGLLYTGAVYFHDKYRPYAYNPDVPMDHKTRGGAKNSFFAGHVALIGTSTFFTAKVFADYHPESRLKWVFYAIAIGTTGTMGYLRIIAGEHFLTDVLIGTAVGTCSGLLVPGFHKAGKDPKVTLLPYFNGKETGASLALKL
jgi:membrane-associated phospholipid phosphatase